MIYFRALDLINQRIYFSHQSLLFAGLSIWLLSAFNLCSWFLFIIGDIVDVDMASLQFARLCFGVLHTLFHTLLGITLVVLAFRFLLRLAFAFIILFLRLVSRFSLASCVFAIFLQVLNLALNKTDHRVVWVHNRHPLLAFPNGVYFVSVFAPLHTFVGHNIHFRCIFDLRYVLLVRFGLAVFLKWLDRLVRFGSSVHFADLSRQHFRGMSPSLHWVLPGILWLGSGIETPSWNSNTITSLGFVLARLGDCVLVLVVDFHLVNWQYL